MKRLSFSIILIFLIIAASDAPQAKVTGECVNCHTMHSSQGGPAPSKWEDKGWIPGTTIKSLLVGSCQGCHCQGGAASITADGIPQVFHTDYTDDLAGGNFKYVALTGGNAAGHNVKDLLDADSLSSPPGYDATYDPSTTGFTSGQVTCAGAQGCHGDRNQTDEVLAVKGAHHTIDTTIDGSDVGHSYRFLGKTGDITGVLGVEDDDWEAETTEDHNEYKGATNDNTSSTISYLCGNCHGKFHVNIYETSRQSPWLRHPTDIYLPSSGEYEGYNPTTTYNNTAPVAYTDPTSISRSTAVIMCLSCHRAHASGSTTPEPYYKLMRWNYKSTTLSTALSGCGVCHTTKN